MPMEDMACLPEKKLLKTSDAKVEKTAEKYFTNKVRKTKYTPKNFSFERRALIAIVLFPREIRKDFVVHQDYNELVNSLMIKGKIDVRHLSDNLYHLISKIND